MGKELEAQEEVLQNFRVALFGFLSFSVTTARARFRLDGWIWTCEYRHIMMLPSPAAVLDVGPVSRLFKALGDKTRLRIVALLSHGELCVCHIQEALEISQPNASRHLAILRAAGVVEDWREGNWVRYRLAAQQNADCQRILRALVGAFAQKKVLSRDIERLLRIRGPAACEKPNNSVR